MKPLYYVYVLECRDKTLYTGITTDVKRRFKEHTSGKGGAYTRSRKVLRILYTQKAGSRSRALKIEYEIKNLSRSKKLDLIKTYGL